MFPNAIGDIWVPQISFKVLLSQSGLARLLLLAAVSFTVLISAIDGRRLNETRLNHNSKY